MYTHYLGIDLHKRSSTWVLVNQKRDVIHKQVIPVTEKALLYGIRALPAPVTNIKATLEPVCGWRWVQQYLCDQGVETVLANPTKVRLIAASKHKTDTNDARMLAELLAADYLPEAYRATPEVADLRSLVRERHYLVSVRTGFKNRLKAVVTATGVNDILENCLTKQGLQYIKEHNLNELHDHHELITTLTTYIKKLDAQIQLALADNELAKLIQTVPVAGPVTTATVVAEVGDFSRFASAKKLTNYAGLVPGQRSSGERVRHGRITKVGSKYLRHVMVESAMRLRQPQDPLLYRWYEQVKAVSSPMKARVALARKLLSIMWYMHKHNTPYTPRNHELG
jgi:transposase